MPIGLGTAIGISAATSAGSAIVGGVMQNRAAGKAGRQQQAALDSQERWEREQDAKNREDNARYEAELKRQWEAEQAIAAEERIEARRRYEQEYGLQREEFAWDKERSARDFEEDRARYQAKETRLQPYRQAGTAAVNQLSAAAAQAGIQLRPVGDAVRTMNSGPILPPPPAPPPPQIRGGSMAQLAR